MQKLLDIGVSESQCLKLAKKHSEERISLCIDMARRQAKTNPAGWVRRALEQDWQFPNGPVTTNDRAKTRLEAAAKAKQEAVEHERRILEERRQAAAIRAGVDFNALRATAFTQSTSSPSEQGHS